MRKPKLPGADCANCPGRDRPLVPPLPAQPAGTQCRLAVVGEGPGRKEVEQGEPFVSPAGRMMARGLATLGLRRHEVHWTNAVPCDVRERDLPIARKCCAERLRLELAAAAPPVVVPVGALGTRSALMASRPTPILKWRGSVNRIAYAAETPAAWVLPTIHPAFVMRSRQWGPVLEIDIARVGRIMRDGWIAPEEQPGREIKIARTWEQLEIGLNNLGKPGDLEGFDVETVGLGPTHTRLVCFALSDGKLTLVVPWSKGRDGRDLWWPDGGKRVAAAVTEHWKSRVVLTHNGPNFDHIVGVRYGLYVSAWEDSLVMAHALHPELKKNLATVVTMGLDVAAWKELEMRTGTLEQLHLYNARDTLYTLLRGRALLAEVKAAA